MNSQSIPAARELARDAASKDRERKAIIVASVATYVLVIWLSWPSLWFPASGPGDQSHLDLFRGLSVSQAAVHVGASWFRPGENLWFWFMAHSRSLVPWRGALLASFVLTTLWMQYGASVLSGSSGDAFCAAFGFSVNPVSLSVLCWLSASHINLCALGLLAYFTCALRALNASTERNGYVALSVVALAFALSFYELAMFAPLVIVLYERWHGVQAPQRVVRWMYAGSTLCVAVYLTVQLSVTQVLHLWAKESVGELFVSSMRYAMANFYLAFNPFETFGVSIPDEPGDHFLANIVCWVLMGMGFATSWSNRKSDPVTAVGGMWYSVFLLPVGTFFHFQGSPIAAQHLYIPLLGVLCGSVKLIARFLERTLASIRIRPLRLIVESTLSIVLLWSLVPFVAECTRTMERWGDPQQLYTTTLRNYPRSSGALADLTQLLATRAPVWQTSTSAEPPSQWQSLIDSLLLRAPPDDSATLREQAQRYARDQSYLEASGSLARAVVASTGPQEQVESGKLLVDTLNQAGLGDQALAVQRWLAQYYPAQSHSFQ